MPQIETFPYQVPHTEAVVPEPWTLVLHGRSFIAPEQLADWDPLAELTISRNLHLDIAKIFEQCTLSRDAEVALCASWLSSGTKLREQISTVPCTWEDGVRDVFLSGNVEGSKLSNSVALITRLVLQKSGRSDGELAPSRSGAILWHDQFSIRLEGVGSRFPVQFAEFSRLGWPAGAAWRLAWRKDFDAMAMGNINLLINSAHKRVSRIAAADFSDPQAPAVKETMRLHVARQLIVGAIESDEFVENASDFPAESVGDAIYQLIKQIFGTESPSLLRQRYRDEPEQFDCELQAGLQLFH